MMWACHHCGRRIDAVERVGRRDTCPGCDSDLHCCCNCRFYAPGLHNECREPQAERQVDKQCGNFCEYFRFAEARAATATKGEDARGALDALFSPGGRRAVGAAGKGPTRHEHSGDCAPPSREQRKP